MAKIRLTEGGFTLIPCGVHIFKITNVEYDEDFGKMIIEMQTKEGLKHTERYSLVKDTGEMNEKALGAYSYFAKTALNNYTVDEIDSDDIVGCYIKANVTHEEFESNKTGKMLKSVRLNDYEVASGFNDSDDDVDADSDDSDDEDDLDNFLK